MEGCFAGLQIANGELIEQTANGFLRFTSIAFPAILQHDQFFLERFDDLLLVVHHGAREPCGLFFFASREPLFQFCPIGSKLLLPVGFFLLVMQGFSELIKRIAVLRGLIPDPAAEEHGPTAEEELAREIVEAQARRDAEAKLAT